MATAATEDVKRTLHFTYIWKIESAPRYATLKSPVFMVQSTKTTKWCLIMNIEKTAVILGIERAKEDDEPEVIDEEFELSILDTNGSWLTKTSVTEHFPKGGFSEDLEFSDTSALFDKRGDEFFPKDTLTVRCRIWRKGIQISKSELCFASTRFHVHKRSCVWAVKGFSSLQQGEKRARILHSTEKGCPRLVLTLSLAEQDNKKCVVIHLKAPRIKNSFEIVAEIALLDAEGMPIFIEQTSLYLDVGENTNKLSVFEKSELISNGAVSSDDALVFRCDMQLISDVPAYDRIEDYKLMDYSPDLETVKRQKSEVRIDELSQIAVCPFKEIINEFKEDGVLSDICLRSGFKSFPVHTLILSCRSPVFRAMFTKDMKEKTSSCVDIPDLDTDTLSRLLLYIYENETQDLTWEAAANLFRAADKFEILDLKENCSSFLKWNISESNVCEILVLADTHHDESLKKSVQEFILNNSEIVYSDVWKVFREDHSKLALETTEQIIYNMKNSIS